ncbi:MAG TPA: alpha/beta fold hydrolase [Saprospiraceae bacterium]|nr:alpha/beta fold hydrolase [Saprospiraceae bacterium]
MKFSWLDKEEYPFTSRFINLEGQQLHYIEEGEGETILFVHGTPSWSFDFRKVICELLPEYHCVAMDHLGFGLSEKPRIADYTPQTHSRRLESFVLTKNFNKITLVLHDFGGPIGFHFAMQHPEKIRRLVVLNSWMWSIVGEPEFNKLKKMVNNPVLPFLYRYLNFSPRFIMPASFGKIKLSKKIKKQYTAPFQNWYEREGMLAFARSLVNDQNWFGELHEKSISIRNKEVLIIWGQKDPILGMAYLHRFMDIFPNHRVMKLVEAGHFPQEENPLEIAHEIRTFMRSGKREE